VTIYYKIVSARSNLLKLITDHMLLEVNHYPLAIMTFMAVYIPR